MPLIFDDAVQNATARGSQNVDGKRPRTRAQYQKSKESAKALDRVGLTSKDTSLKSEAEQQSRSKLHPERNHHCVLVIAERAGSCDKGDPLD